MNTLAQMVMFPSDGHTTPGYLAQPEDGQPHPGLVIIQEWWGLVDHIKDVAVRFARQGFITLAPDLYYGRSCTEPDEARKLALELDRDRAVQEIAAAAGYLRKMDRVSPKKIGVAGWCMGGSLAVATAAHATDLGAVVAFYGMPRDLAMVQDIHAPLLGLYGGHDHGITTEMIQEFDQELKKRGVPHEIHQYPEAGHAFFNDTRPNAYHPQAAQDAWQRTLDWLHQHLA